MSAPHSVTSSQIIAAGPSGAGKKGGDTVPRSDTGESEDALCDRLAAMSLLEYQKARDEEAHRLRLSKGALDELRKQGLRKREAAAERDESEDVPSSLSSEASGKGRGCGSCSRRFATRRTGTCS